MPNKSENFVPVMVEEVKNISMEVQTIKDLKQKEKKNTANTL